MSKFPKKSNKISSDLIVRKNLFKRNFKNKNSKKECDLIFSYNIEKSLLNDFLSSVKIFVVSSLNFKNKRVSQNTKWSKILKEISLNRPPNITHNGLFVPKKEISLEYNLMLISFINLLKKLNLGHKIKYFIGPPQLRIKFGNKKKKFMPNSSEYLHSDAWTQINTKSCSTLFLPLVGDYKKNYVEFFYPKHNYSDQWLDKRYFMDGKNMINHYKKLNLQYTTKKCLIADSSILHQSVTKNNCQARLSMDIGLIPFNFKSKNYSNHSNHVPYEIIEKIGKDKLMIYKDSIEKKVKKTKVGTNTQANRQILSLGQ
tara:strand:- start:851 stop:1792 length:942 start_codon:yes stop_codon:yes gene_type:complete